jgi:hypothetical protein
MLYASLPCLFLACCVLCQLVEEGAALQRQCSVLLPGKREMVHAPRRNGKPDVLAEGHQLPSLGQPGFVAPEGGSLWH